MLGDCEVLAWLELLRSWAGLYTPIKGGKSKIFAVVGASGIDSDHDSAPSTWRFSIELTGGTK